MVPEPKSAASSHPWPCPAAASFASMRGRAHHRDRPDDVATATTSHLPAVECLSPHRYANQTDFVVRCSEMRTVRMPHFFVRPPPTAAQCALCSNATDATLHTSFSSACHYNPAALDAARTPSAFSCCAALSPHRPLPASTFSPSPAAPAW